MVRKIRCETPARRSQAIPKQWVIKRIEAGIYVSSAQSGSRSCPQPFLNRCGSLFCCSHHVTTALTDRTTAGYYLLCQENDLGNRPFRRDPNFFPPPYLDLCEEFSRRTRRGRRSDSPPRA